MNPILNLFSPSKKLSLNANKEFYTAILEHKEIEEFMQEIKQFLEFKAIITEKKSSEQKEKIISNLLKTKKTKINRKSRRISRFEIKLHRYRSRIDKEIAKLQQNKELFPQLAQIKQELDIYENITIKMLSSQNGEIITALKQTKIDWNKINQLSTETMNAITGIIICTEKIKKIQYLEKKKTEYHNYITPNLIAKEYNSADRSYSYNMIFETAEYYQLLLEDIKRAKYKIMLEVYQFNPDKAGLKITSALMEKATEFEGKNKLLRAANKPEKYKIIVIMDGCGSPSERSLTKKFAELIENMTKTGIECHIFNPPSHSFIKYNAFSVLRHPLVSFFGRNHRKLIIIDNEIAYLGGMNIAEEYLVMRDTNIRLTGIPIMALTKSYLNSLSLCKNYEYHSLRYLSEMRKEKNKQYIEAKKQAKSINYNPHERNGFKIIDNIPSLIHHGIRDEYIKFIQSASKSINITNPYFIPGMKFVNVLIKAAKRGVDVKIILPKKTDHPIIDNGTKKYYFSLLKNGVKIYHYDKPNITMIHAKTMTIDSKYSTIGSCNLDYVSLSLNHEINLFIANENIAKALNEQFAIDLKYSEEVNFKKFSDALKGRTLIETAREKMSDTLFGSFLNRGKIEYQ